ncbi:MAG: hypothetical protein HFH94_11275 [Lachnospiraceae bacterium]|jgi:hypothetical protein|nr:hypothetical protein [uncultured Acetatifactor sp.]MCI9220299.1 hypothetical protein [Lachnospiraceae bacterium]
MNIYTVSDDKKARDIMQLLRLNAECARLHWSRTITDVPNDVISSLNTIEQYIETKVIGLCDSKMNSLGDEEERQMLDMIKKDPFIKDTLGVGVVMRGNQANELIKKIKGKNQLSKIQAAVESGMNVVIF